MRIVQVWMDSSWQSWFFGALYVAIMLTLAVAIVMQRRPVGVSLAWLVLLFALPGAGFVLYLMFGSRRLGMRRLKRMRTLYPDYTQWYQHLSKVIAGDRKSVV